MFCWNKDVVDNFLKYWDESLINNSFCVLITIVLEQNIVVSLFVIYGQSFRKSSHWPTVMWHFQRLVITLFNSRYRSESNPFLSSPLFEKPVRTNYLLRIFRIPGNRKWLTDAIQHFLFFGTAFVTFFMVWDIYHVLQILCKYIYIKYMLF